ncbi:hypothetical protein CMUS01_09136 [Colletotrichum musicola]|uniref:Uncharacterized protein n=1 Tax=Colletotrichum musicola TaxID=2175873 RepID=A0A8H6NC30_9PEZI|nr:hypothetical protein CMUS01_09136 [Colletotrichum musicola]
MRRRALLLTLGSFTVRGSPGVPSKPTTTFRSPPPRRLPPLISIPSSSLTAAHEYVPHTALSSGRRYLPNLSRAPASPSTQHPALFSALQPLRYTWDGASTTQLGEFTEQSRYLGASGIFPSSHLCAPRTASLGPNVPSSPSSPSSEHDHDTTQSASLPWPSCALCTTPAAHITCTVQSTF